MPNPKPTESAKSNELKQEARKFKEKREAGKFVLVYSQAETTELMADFAAKVEERERERVRKADQEMVAAANLVIGYLGHNCDYGKDTPDGDFCTCNIAAVQKRFIEAIAAIRQRSRR